MTTQEQKIANLKSNNAELIKILTDFFIKHGRGASKHEIQIACKDNAKNVLAAIDRLERANIIKKEYLVNQKSGEYHTVFIPADILEEYNANKDKQQQESINNQIWSMRQIYWITKVKWQTQLKHWAVKIFNKKKAKIIYDSATEPAITK